MFSESLGEESAEKVNLRLKNLRVSSFVGGEGVLDVSESLSSN